MNDYGAILNKLNTEVSTFKTDLPNSLDTTGGSTTSDSFISNYIYHIIGVCIVVLTVSLVVTKPFFIMKDEFQVENNVKYKSRKICLRKLGISMFTICILVTVAYFVYKYKFSTPTS